MKLRQRFMEVRKRKGLAKSTEDAYWHWVDKYLRFHREQSGDWVKPSTMNERHVEQFLSHHMRNASCLRRHRNHRSDEDSMRCYLVRCD